MNEHVKVEHRCHANETTVGFLRPQALSDHTRKQLGLVQNIRQAGDRIDILRVDAL